MEPNATWVNEPNSYHNQYYNVSYLHLSTNPNDFNFFKEGLKMLRDENYHVKVQSQSFIVPHVHMQGEKFEPTLLSSQSHTSHTTYLFLREAMETKEQDESYFGVPHNFKEHLGEHQNTSKS